MNEPTPNPPPSPGPPSGSKLPAPQRRISSSDLLAGDREILIDHQGETYRLSVTRSGKLILHK
ncbi:MAG TPA: hemin uptake protein HemP [Pirellulales bacterium]|nr:hemin uptake protein HemP [Pirellulales bacterium]